MLAACCAIMLAFAAAAPAEESPAADLAAACASVKRDIAAARAALADGRDRRHEERTALRAQLLALEEQIEAARSEAEKAEETARALERASADDASSAATARRELERAGALVAEARAELEAAVARTGPVGGTFVELDAVLAGPRSEEAATSARDLLLEILRGHFAAVAGLRRVEVPVVLPDGTTSPGELLLAGGFLGVVRGVRAGLVALPPGADAYHVVGSGLSRAQRRAVDRSFPAFERGDVVMLPLDVSGGRALGQLEQAASWWDWLRAGGICMIPLGLVAVLALGMSVERLIVLGRADARIDPLLARALPLVERGDFDGAAAEVRGVESAASRVVLAGLAARGMAMERLEEILEDAVLREVPRLERFVGTLGLFAGIAPLLGLLGTVSGLIETFHVITAYGTGNARLLAAGISEALITTEVGLGIAIPLVLLHAWLSRRVRGMVGHLERAAATLAGLLGSPGEEP